MTMFSTKRRLKRNELFQLTEIAIAKVDSDIMVDSKGSDLAGDISSTT